MKIYSNTDIGKVRNENEDAFYASLFSDNTVLAIVCDGMGGANAGKTASETAVESIRRYVETAYKSSLSNDGIIQLLQNSILSANIELFEMAKKDPDLKGMGTTVVAAIIRDNNAIVCHVGDSRAYIVNNDIVQITKDHSVVQTLVESGKLTPEEAKTHPEKNIITRALGVEENVLSDYTSVLLEYGDKLVLCSDGLTNFVSNESILDTFSENIDNDYAELLCSKANENGGGDNVTVIVVSND